MAKDEVLEPEDDYQDDELNSETDENSENAESATRADSGTKAADDPLILATSNSAHEEVRQSLAADVEAFLARGGQIEQVEDNVMGDPPRKPQSNYGSRPI